MFERRAVLTVPLPVGLVFDFLRGRYESLNYRQASLATKGYVPSIECLNVEENRCIELKVRGRNMVSLRFVDGPPWCGYGRTPGGE